jgi:Lsr2
VKELTVVAWDDRVLHETGHKVPATESVRLGWNNAWYSLDLSEANHQELLDALDPFLAAGTPDHGGGQFNMRRGRDWWKGLRSWADSEGRTTEYHRPSDGKISYPRKLIRDYEAWLEAQAKDGGK